MHRRQLLNLLLVSPLFTFPLGAFATQIRNARLWRSDDKLRLVFDLSGPVQYKTFSLTSPERVIIDLSGAGLSGDFSQLALKNSGITSIRSGHFGKADTRIVLDLAAPMQLNSFLLPPQDGQGHRLVLDLTGAAMVVSALRSDARLALIAVTVATVFCLADWLLVEDLGFLGGLGTDPNNMIPIALLLVVGYLGLAHQPEPAVAAEAAEPPERDVPAEPAAGPARGFSGLLRGFASVPAGVIAAVGAFAIVLVGAAPMALASVNKNADPIVAEAIAGTNGTLDTPAPNFTLTSQDGRKVTLSSMRGKVVLLTFLDPVCTTDCPLIAQEMRTADTILGSKASDTELVAVVANPTYTSLAYTQAFDREEGLGQVPNWLYLTGSLSQLAAVWHHFGIEVEDLPAGAMVAHNDIAFVISAGGQVQQEISDDPGPGTAASKSSFASLMANSVIQSMEQRQ